MRKVAEEMLQNYTAVKEGAVRDHVINALMAANATLTPIAPTMLAGQHISNKYGLHESPMIKESPVGKAAVNLAAGTAGTGGTAPLAGAGAAVAGEAGLKKLKARRRK